MELIVDTRESHIKDIVNPNIKTQDFELITNNSFLFIFKSTHHILNKKPHESYAV